MIPMKNLSAPVYTVSVVRKVFEEGFGVLQDRVIVPSIRILIITVKTRSMRIDASPKASPRWPANRRRAMSIGESNALSGQSRQVRSLRLRMPAHAFQRIVQVIADDEQDVGTLTLSDAYNLYQ